MVRTFLLLFLILPALFLSASAEEDVGEAIYRSRCKVCHGEDGNPKKFAEDSASFNDEAWKKATTPEAIERVIAEGRKRMPAFKNKLTPEEIKAVSAYVKIL